MPPLTPPDPATRTAVAALWGRAVEQARDRPLLRDPAAACWLDAFQFDTTRLAGATATQVAVCARARWIDRWVFAWAEQHPRGVVVELGVGFSTRALRLAHLALHFVGVDRAAVADRRATLDLTTKTLPPTLIADVTQPDLPDLLRSAVASRPACFIAEGLLMFLEPAKVDRLLATLAASFPRSPLFFDAYAPLARPLQRFHDSLGHLGEPLRSTFTRSTHLQLHESPTLRDTPDAFARLPRHYRLPHVHRLHATHRAILI